MPDTRPPLYEEIAGEIVQAMFPDDFFTDPSLPVVREFREKKKQIILAAMVKARAIHRLLHGGDR